ncbi:DNA cytosine methyltransferase [Microbacterium oxydans]|uniref:DNA cytosine methyltransferase n=1 Tax=Microbacterium oxydans TaxID=82380 RepID=UPI0037C4F668
MRVLNAYAGIGGNRHLWPDDWKVTAVEWNARVAAEYQTRYPNDTVVVADAHQYVLDHAHEFDAIWTSPPCPTHSRINNTRKVKPTPDPSLWEQITFLRELGLPFVVENVHTYYEPPTLPDLVTERHYYWTNRPPTLVTTHWTPAKLGRRHETADELADNYGLPRLAPGSVPDRRLAMRNAVLPGEGLEIALAAFIGVGVPS